MRPSPMVHVCLHPSCGLHPRRFPALCQGARGQHRTSMRAVIRSTPGVLAPAGLCCPGHLRLADPIRPTRRHLAISPPCGLYERPSLCQISRPRQPTSGSELSLMVFRNMSSSTTTGNFPVAFTQCFTGNSGLRHEGSVSAFPSPSHSDSGEEVFSRLDYGSLALRPVALLALLSEQTGFLQPSRAFTSGLPTVWSPAPPPDITTVPTGQPARAGLSPARSPTSFTALPQPPSPHGRRK